MTKQKNDHKRWSGAKLVISWGVVGVITIASWYLIIKTI